MSSRLARAVRLAPLALAAALLPGRPGAAAADEPVVEPDHAVICSLSDVKGKTVPCGCRTPMGGLARIASVADSLRGLYTQTFLVDGGGYFPEEDERRDAATFLMSAYHLLDFDAVGVGDRDLRFGFAFLRENARARSLPIVCANLIERATGQPAFPATRLVQRGALKVGFFGLVSDTASLGPGRDSLLAQDPKEAARRAVADLRRQGADVVVALTALGKAPSEDVCGAVSGIDVAIVGRSVPYFEEGRTVGKSFVVYGGDESQHMGITHLTLDDAHHVTAASGGAYVLGPQVRDKPSVAAMAKAFEDALAARQRKSAAK